MIEFVAMARYAKKPIEVEHSSSEEFVPRTELGRRLWELRKKIVASGEPLLSRDEIEREVAERRGGVSEHDL
jgi:hypothetical protein